MFDKTVLCSKLGRPYVLLVGHTRLYYWPGSDAKLFMIRIKAKLMIHMPILIAAELNSRGKKMLISVKLLTKYFIFDI